MTATGTSSDFSDHEPAGVPFDRGARKAGNFFVGDARGACKFVGKSAEARAEHERDFRAQLRFRENEFRGALGAGKVTRRLARLASARRSSQHDPTIDADIRLAIVPASMARMPESRKLGFLVWRERADAADLDADRAEIRESAKREGGDREGARIERRLHRSEPLERDEFVRHHAQAEQVGDGVAVAARECRSPRRPAKKASRKSARRSTETRRCRARPAGCARRRSSHRPDKSAR